jgi:hypothetical protein
MNSRLPSVGIKVTPLTNRESMRESRELRRESKKAGLAT